MTETAAAGSLWRNRNYMWYRASRAVSMLGTRISGMAGPLLVLSIGGGPVRAGLTGTAMLAARMAAQLPAGYLADRFDQRRLMLAMDMMRMALVGSIPLAAAFGHLIYPHLLAVAVIEGAASTVFTSTAMVFLRLLIPSGQFSRAMGQSQAMNATSSLAGPALGGALFAVDRVLPYIVDCASYLLSGVMLLAVSARAVRPAEDRPKGSEKTDRRVTAGLRWLWRQKGIMRIVVFCSVLNLVGAAAGVAAIVVLSQRGTPPGIIGVIMACSGSGALLGSLASSRIVRLGPTRLFLSYAFLWGASLGSIAWSSSPWVVGSALTFLGVLGPATGVMMFQILRDDAPAEMYGRVLSSQQMLGTGLASAGPLLAGILVAAFGGTYLWLVLAGTCVVAALLVVQPLPQAGQVEAPGPTTGQAVPMTHGGG